MKFRLGEIFVRNGLITETTLKRALAKAKRENKKVGFVLEEMEVVTGEEVAAALADQFGYRIAPNLAGCRVPAELLDIVPMYVALQYLLFPLKIDRGKIAVAMADPTEKRIIANIAANQGLKVVPFVAPRKEILEAINRNYFGKMPEPRRERLVLLVEENMTQMLAVTSLLAREGYRVVGAKEGMEAYRLAVTDPPDVVITEKNVPKLDGYSLLAALRNIPETRKVPVLMLTSATDGEEEARAFERGFFDFIPKPVREMTLVTRVKRAIGG